MRKAAPPQAGAVGRDRAGPGPQAPRGRPPPYLVQVLRLLLGLLQRLLLAACKDRGDSELRGGRAGRAPPAAPGPALPSRPDMVLAPLPSAAPPLARARARGIAPPGRRFRLAPRGHRSASAAVAAPLRRRSGHRAGGRCCPGWVARRGRAASASSSGTAGCWGGAARLRQTRPGPTSAANAPLGRPWCWRRRARPRVGAGRSLPRVACRG